MKKKMYIFLILFVLFLLTGCEQLFFQEVPSAMAIPTFDYLWNRVNEQYAYFDVKSVDWDSAYIDYRPNIYNGMPDDSLFYYMGDMLNLLRDGHVNLYSEFNISRFDISLLGPQNIQFRLIKENYLGSDYYITGPFVHDFIAGGRVGYIRYASFMDNFSNEQISYIFERYRESEGLILDMRQNGGGLILNVFLLLSRFCDSDTALYSTCIKNGPGHQDFSEQSFVYNTVQDSLPVYDRPVAVLIDRGSYSATSLFALATLALDNIFLVGDSTGGGLGMPNGGQLPNGWTYRFSITRTLSLDGINYENGVPPDIYVVLDSLDTSRGRDTVIEAALNVLLKNS